MPPIHLHCTHGQAPYMRKIVSWLQMFLWKFLWHDLLVFNILSSGNRENWLSTVLPGPAAVLQIMAGEIMRKPFDRRMNCYFNFFPHHFKAISNYNFIHYQDIQRGPSYSSVGSWPWMILYLELHIIRPPSMKHTVLYTLKPSMSSRLTNPNWNTCQWQPT